MLTSLNETPTWCGTVSSTCIDANFIQMRCVTGSNVNITEPILNAPFKSGTWHGVSIEMQRFRQLNQCRVKWEQLQVETIQHNHI